MATTIDTLVQRMRRFLRDYPISQDTLGGNITSSSTSFTVINGAQFNQSGNQIIEIDFEAMLLKSVSTNTLTIARGYGGSTPASHTSAATILVNPAFLSIEIIDAINAAKDEMFPQIYKPVLDTSLTADGLTYEFTVPNMPGSYGGDTIVIPYISRIELLVNGDVAYRPVRDWDIRRGATPKIRFRSPPVIGTIRVHGFGPFVDMAASGDALEPLWPKNAEKPLITGAASRILASGEAGRLRADTGARDDREAAQKAGASQAASDSLYKRFQFQVQNAAMPPMPKHVIPVL